MKRRVAVRGIAIQGGKILCAQLKPYRHADSPTYWCTPGGGVDPGEALVPALEREIIEETGVAPQVGDLLYAQQFIHKDVEQMEFFFHITNPEDFTNIDLSQTSHGKDEIEKIEFVDPKVTHVLPVFLQEEDVEAHIREKRGVKIFNYLD